MGVGNREMRGGRWEMSEWGAGKEGEISGGEMGSAILIAPMVRTSSNFRREDLTNTWKCEFIRTKTDANKFAFP